MKTDAQNREELIHELKHLKQRITELEKSKNHHERLIEHITKLSFLKELLIGTHDFEKKLKLITDFIVDTFDADFARIWVINEGDICYRGCRHGKITEGPHVCRDKTRCLHLKVSSGRYTHIDGEHRRVPFGCYKIGRVASGKYPQFVTNDVTHDPQVHNHEWARELGLRSFAGFKLISSQGDPMGVLAFFSKHKITTSEEKFFRDLATTTSQVVIASEIEHALEESENKYHTIFENSGNAMMFIDEDMTIAMINKELEVIGGYSKEEVEGQIKWTEFIAKKEDLERMRKYHKLRRINSRDVPKSYEFQIKSKNGQLKDVIATVSIIPGTKKSLASLVDITPRKQFERELQASEEKFREVFNNANDALFLLKLTEYGLKEKFSDVNDVACLRMGYSREELLKMSPADIDVSSVSNLALKWDAIIDNHDSTFETVHIAKNGKKIPVEINARIFDLKGEKFILAIARDISERKKMENELKESLQEKEMLLKEIHHRVKNNLMVISSLLNLQSDYIKDKEALGIFKESQSRARSMALIHERLYQSQDLKRIDFGDYIQTLTLDLFNTYQVDPGLVKLNIQVEDIKLDINTAIPLGLIVNELVSNSMKHAFPDAQSGEITIDFHKMDGNYLLQVSDDGVGFPEDLDFQKTDSLGLQLVNSLVGQIDATIRLDRSHGTSFTIKFKEMEL